MKIYVLESAANWFEPSSRAPILDTYWTQESDLYENSHSRAQNTPVLQARTHYETTKFD